MQRFLILAAGVAGAAGVGLLAAAAHIGGDNLRTAAAFILAHAPALLAIGLMGRNRTIVAAACVMLAGVALFAGDLVMRDVFGERLFAMAAPTGGTLTMLGWLGVALSALLPAYLEVQRALASDDFDTAKAAWRNRPQVARSTLAL